MTSLVIIGEAWGEQEARYEHPFVGPAGQELYRMLGQAGYPCDDLPYQFVSPYRMIKMWSQFPHQLLNVFNQRPPDPEGKNRVDYFYARLSENVPVDRGLPKRRLGSANGYVRAEYAHHVHELHARLEALRPNLIIALGATAMWALGLPTTVGKLRGSIATSRWGKVLPIYHPASVLRNWSQRVISIIDFYKARREAAYPEVRTKKRFIWTEPSIEDLYEWWDTYGSPAPLLAVDIETLRRQQISEIGFAASSTQALHVPFFIEDACGKKTYRNWWPDTETELRAWQFVKMVCESPVPKIGQNVVQYDVYWLVKEMGIQLRNVVHDTMVMAHAWQPEWQKNLGFLGSIFCDEKSWKSIRKDVAKGED
jgi:uracil-DNA glycosylase